MKKSAILTTMVMCLGLIGMEAWLLATPAEAADCTAQCAGGGHVTCSGTTCSATDNAGCTGRDSDGRIIIQMSCNSY